MPVAKGVQPEWVMVRDLSRVSSRFLVAFSLLAIQRDNSLGMLRKLASQDFDICLRNYCGSFADNCGDLWRLYLSLVKLPTSIAEIRGDDEYAHPSS